MLLIQELVMLSQISHTKKIISSVKQGKLFNSIILLAQNTYADILSTNGGNNWPNIFETLGRFFFISIVFVAVLLLSYFFTKWIAKQKSFNLSSNNIRIIEAVSVGISSSIQLVQVGGKYILIGVNKDRIAFLTEVDKDDVVINENKSAFNGISFEKYLKLFMNNKNHDSGDNE